MRKIRVGVRTTDPLARAGILDLIEPRAAIEVVGDDEVPDGCDVVVLAVDDVDFAALALMRSWAARTEVPVVLVPKHLHDIDLMSLVERRVMAVLARGQVTADRLTGAVMTVSTGGAVLPSDVLGDLLRQMERLSREVLAPQGLSEAGMSTRELDVLRLVADGMDTAEIGRRLSYSERTVKLILHQMTTRLKLRSRAHAVAYAVRAGLL